MQPVISPRADKLFWCLIAISIASLARGRLHVPMGLLYLLIAGLYYRGTFWLLAPLKRPASESAPTASASLPAFAILVLTLIAFFGILFHFATGLAFYDDYQTSVVLITRIKNSSHFMEWIPLLYGRLMEHYVVGYNLLCSLSYFATGYYSADFLRCIGVPFLFLFGFLFYRSLKPLPQRPWTFVIAALLVLQFQFHQILLWPSNFAGMFLLLSLIATSFLLLDNPRKTAFAASLATGISAVFSFGNGFVVMLINLLRLIYEKRNSRRTLVWIFATGISVSLFLGVRNDRDTTKDVLLFGRFLFSFFGSAITLGKFAYYPRPVATTGLAVLAFFTGLALIGCFAFVTRKRYFLVNPVIYSWLLLCVGSGILTALQRSYFGYSQVFASRYTFWSALFIACLWIAFSELYPRRATRYLPAVVLLAIAFNAFSSYVTFPYMQRHITNLRYGTYYSHYRPNAPLASRWNLEIGEEEHNAYLSSYVRNFRSGVDAGILRVPTQEFRNALGSEKVEGNGAAFPKASVVSTSLDEVFLEVVFTAPPDAESLPLAVCIDAGCFRAMPLSQHPAHPDILKHYYSSLSNWTVLIPNSRFAQVPKTIEIRRY